MADLTAIEQLSLVEQAITFAAIIDGQDAAARLDRFEDQTRRRCAAAYQAFQRLDSERRKKAAATLSRRLFSPVPENIERVHPTWIRPLLQQLRPSIMARVAQLLPEKLLRHLAISPAAPPAPLRTAALHCLVRQLFSPIAPMPQHVATRFTPLGAEQVATLSSSQTERLLSHLGCLALVALLKKARARRGKHLLTQLPPPYQARAKQLLAASSPPLPRSFRAPEVQGLPSSEMLLVLGIHVLAPALSTTSCRQIAQLLPKHLAKAFWAANEPRCEAHSVQQWLSLAEAWTRGG